MHNYTPSTVTPPTLVPVVDDGDVPSAANLSSADKANADGVGYLNAVKAPIASPTFTGTVTLPDTVLPNGKTFTENPGSIHNIRGTATVTDGTWQVQNAAKNLHDSLISLADGNATLDLNTGGQRIIMRTIPAGARVLTLRQVANAATPPDGFWFEVTVLLAGSLFTVSLQREGAIGTYVAVLGDGAGNKPWGVTNQAASVRVKKEAGVWRLEWAGAGPCFFGGDA